MGLGLYEFSYDGSVSSWEDAFAAVAAESLLSPITLILSLASYILLGIGMYTIAKRRGINHAWLAWIPIGKTWLLGCISDQYRYVARREEKRKRTAMLILDILTSAVCVAMLVFFVLMLIETFAVVGHVLNLRTDLSATADLIRYASWTLGLLLVTTVLGLVLQVLTYMAYYDLFASCDPNNKTVFLVLGIFFGIAMSIFVFACRNKDYGMPPRRDTMQPDAWTPPQQTWQPPQPPLDPWEQNRQ